MLLDCVQHIKDTVQALSASQHRGHKLGFVAGGHPGVAHYAVVILNSV
jgi:hypothetical protein